MSTSTANSSVPNRTGLVAVNGRYRAHRIAGQQRYANELIERLSRHMDVLEPAQPLKGLRGHAWEQSVLPRATSGRLLWSPCQSGPAFVRNQVVTFHDLFALENPEWFSRQYVWLYRQLLPRLARNARRLIAVSGYTKQRMVEVLGVAPEKIEVVHSGISPQFMPPDAEEIQQARKQLQLPSGRYLLSVSSLEPRKNVPRLLEAWRRVQAELPEDLWLVLSGGNGSAAVFAAESLDVTGLRVHFTGYVEDSLLHALYGGAHGFLYPSLAEGFGFPVLEAMACGTPTLTANTSALPEVTGDAALAVDPENTDEIARAIVTLVHDAGLQATLRHRGLAQAKQFTWQRSAAATWQVLQQEQERIANRMPRARGVSA